MSDSLSKLVGFAVLDQTDVELSKLVSYAVLNPSVVSNAKLVSFAVLLTPPPPLTTLVDTVATSDAFSLQANFTLTLTDVVNTSDQFLVVGPTGEDVIFSGLIRRSLTSGLTVGSKVALSGIIRRVLISAQSTAAAEMRFSGITRKVLALQTQGPGPIAIFPSLPEGFPVKVSPSLDTIVGTSKSLREMRLPQRYVPLWDIEINFEELRDQTQNAVPYAIFAGLQQYEQLVQTWLMMYGQTNVFAFNAPWDNSRLDQQIGVGDGTNVMFTIYRTWGTGNVATLAPIGLINQMLEVRLDNVVVNPIRYYANGNRLFFVGTDGLVAPPPAGAVITATFSFYYLCRFVEDEQDTEEFAYNRWVINSLKFRAINWIFG